MIRSLDIEKMLVEDQKAALTMAGFDWDANELPQDTEVRHLHYNRPQLRSMLIEANQEIAIWGRGTGKSEGRIAPRSKRNVEVMPRSHGVFVGATYIQLIERTLPPVIKGWEAMGWKRDRDFWFRKMPPKSAGVPAPVIGPLASEHCIFFRNGAVASMVSQDRPGSANGKTVHWIIGDEAKFLNKKRLDEELLLTNRGDEIHFGGIPEFHSTLFTTDMPTWKEAFWLLEKEKEMDKVRIDYILALQAEIFNLWQKYLVANGKAKTAIFNRIQKYRKMWDQLRANATYFSEASTWENVEGFGLKNLCHLKKVLPRYVYRTAILNQRPFLTSESFYPDLSQDKHTYTSINYSFVDDINEKGEKASDCRKDADLDVHLPLHIALDYGAHINTVEIGQLKGYDFQVINSLEVTHPQKLRDLAKKMMHYYRFHQYKVIFYYFDHTAIAQDGKVDYSYAEEWVNLFRASGEWRIIPIYIGATPSPKSRYELWGKALRGEHEKIRSISFNRENCEYLLESMRNAKLKKGSGRYDDYRKDKDDERNLEIDQRTTTHHSDAVDTLLIGISNFDRSMSVEGFTLDVVVS